MDAGCKRPNKMEGNGKYYIALKTTLRWKRLANSNTCVPCRGKIPLVDLLVRLHPGQSLSMVTIKSVGTGRAICALAVFASTFKPSLFSCRLSSLGCAIDLDRRFAVVVEPCCGDPEFLGVRECHGRHFFGGLHL